MKDQLLTYSLAFYPPHPQKREKKKTQNSSFVKTKKLNSAQGMKHKQDPNELLWFECSDF